MGDIKTSSDNNVNTEKLLQYMLMQQMFSQIQKEDSTGSFQVALSSVMNAYSDAGNTEMSGLLGSSSFGLSDDDLSSLGYGAGTPLYNAYKDLQSNADNYSSSGNITIDEAVKNASQKYGVDEKLIRAIIKHESGYNPNAVSSAGAQGLMQLMPTTAAGLGVTNSFDVNQNVDGGTKLLRNLLDMYGNCKEMALAAYSAGPYGLKSRGITDESQIYKAPSETVNYVKSVMQDYNNSR